MADKAKDRENKAGEQEASPPPPKKGKKRWVVLLILFLVLALAGGAGAFLILPRLMSSGDIDQAEEGQENGGQASSLTDSASGEKQELGILMSLNPFIVNLLDTTGKRYLKVKLDLDLSDEKTKLDVEYRLPQIQDSLLILLSSKSYEDISSTEGKMRLRMEIISRMNDIISAGKVNNVYFTEFVVQ